MDISKDDGEIRIKCSLCDDFDVSCPNPGYAKEALLDHLKEAHSDIYDPMTLVLEERKGEDSR